MKRFKDFFITICLVVLSSLTTYAQTQVTNESARQTAADDITISLLTCSPGSQVWSLYGHTAIRFQDPAHDVDLAINYGMFNFNQKNFIARFVFGITDYEMGIEPFAFFLQEYARNGRGVIGQRLNLTTKEKEAIADALNNNYKPANRVYRYNYFYDNCTTRARDILVNNIDGRVTYDTNDAVSPSYRQMTHQWTGKHRWSQMGNDLLLGVKADAHTTRTQQQFLPDTLRKDFDHAVIVAPNGTHRLLVDSTYTVLQPYPSYTDTSNDIWDDISPIMIFSTIALLIFVLALLELKRKKPFWFIDATLLTTDGLAGLILFAMVFSQHPTVNLNLQILLLNPLSIIFAYSIIRQQIKGLCHWYWKVLLACLVLFLLGNIFQDYAEGMNILALTLMVRCIINIKTLRTKGKQPA
ncbi:MAG: DUF4105 domain-containing protein [Prevotella sp.]|uniref:Lnb N-terminal periplasmic domain-containing protein n=1 Tax=Hallella TaxID=52228 RepID=UPI002A91A8E9|nr:DUF4105 domain-containing protein [Hallella sp.]MBS7399144.1 DUF4105 domain-containing protein [Prevotella sp.]MCI7433114.1 DUF4105 domain-containing protein [Prevotella sp.]MDY5926231.1 DUF4105 domain-containing protein [Hallella sp.]MED9945950.1 DUF4105 domain-containing protein [Hallella sp.]